MKAKSIVTILFLSILLIDGCKKDAIGGGKKILEGTITYHDGVSLQNPIAPDAKVYITYGSLVSTGTVDETVTTDSRGMFSIKKLKKGDYFVTAEYTNSPGFTYTTKGHGITIDDSKSTFSMNLILY